MDRDSRQLVVEPEDLAAVPGGRCRHAVRGSYRLRPATLGLALSGLWVLSGLLAVLSGGCSRDVHDRVEVRGGDCVLCHREDYDRTANPVHRGLFPETCGDCHNERAWVPAVGFGAHDWFPLTEGHADVPCSSCHTEGYGEGQTPTECVGCHRRDYDRSPFPGHNVFPFTCQDCHNTTAWRPASFDHEWPLTGAHVGTPCAGCHTGDPPRYEGTPTECVACHRGDYDRSPYPGHDRFPLTCQDCHDTRTWRGPSFEHPWSLSGAHAWAPCGRCHTGDPPRYEGTPRECSACHVDDYERSTYPGHHVFPMTCQDCHGSTTWRPSTFTHDWELTGAHVGTACNRCHTGDPPRYEGTPTECAGCHRGDYDRAATRVDGHGGFPLSCTDCHTTVTWLTGSFDHPWRLDGAHTTTPCSDCHTGDPPRYAGTPTECVDCHRADYDRSTHPGHDTYPLTCTDCHRTAAWRPATFSHSWPLLGAHTRTSCGSCHGDPPRYEGTPRACVGCHRADYDRSTYPGHDRFPTTCGDCHNNNGWRPASFVHSFPLDGGHARATCTSCHGDPPTYAGTPSDCVACHRADYDRAATTVSGHAGYSTRCAECHSTAAFRPSSFTHPWELTGAHATAACAGCHGDPPRYTGIPRLCGDCHGDDFARATFPGHSSFPSTCGDCHGTFTWSGARFDHSWSLVGAHSFAPCAGCHTGSPPRYAGTPTDCLSCHRADGEASPYAPHPTFGAACADCHTPSGWTPASRGYHSESTFRITSGHHARPCIPCHEPALGEWWGGANTNCTDGGCHYHDRSREDSRHSGVRGYPTGTTSPSFCLDCHDRVRG